MSRIKFTVEEEMNRYSAENGKIDEVGLSILQNRYESKGFSFYNEDNEAVMEWSDDVDGVVRFSAQCDFENYVVHA